MKQSWKQIRGNGVHLSVEQAAVGHVSAALFNPENGRVLAYMVGLSKAITPSDVQVMKKKNWLVGEDAFINPLDLHRVREFGLRRCFIYGKKVLSKSGKNLGRVRDYTLEHHQLVQIECRGLFKPKRLLPADWIDEITQSAIVLDREAEGMTGVLAAGA